MPGEPVFIPPQLDGDAPVILSAAFGLVTTQVAEAEDYAVYVAQEEAAEG